MNPQTPSQITPEQLRDWSENLTAINVRGRTGLPVLEELRAVLRHAADAPADAERQIQQLTQERDRLKKELADDAWRIYPREDSQTPHTSSGPQTEPTPAPKA